jgi:drug/metabolite transporter (DMT)-like permease
LLCGAAFALSGVAYRAAGLALEGEVDFVMRAAVTLAFVTVLQTVLLTGWMAWQRAGALGAVLRQWRLAAPVGVAGMLASLGWFAAFTLVPAAHVKAVGQVELVFSLADRALRLRRASVACARPWASRWSRAGSWCWF